MTDVSMLADRYELQTVMVDGITAPADAAKATLDAMEGAAQRAAAALTKASGASAEAGEQIEVVDAQWERFARRNDAVTAAAQRLATAEALLADAQTAAGRAMTDKATDQETVSRTLTKLSDNVAVQKARLIEVREATEAATLAETSWRGAHEQTVAAINAAQQSGKLSAHAAAEALDVESVAYARNIEAAAKASREVEHHGLTTQQTTFIMRQFTREGVAGFAELAAGGDVMPVLTGAFVSLAQEMTLSKHGFHLVVEGVQEFAEAVGGLGVVVATAGVAALTAALIGLAYYAETTAREEARWAAQLSVTREEYTEMAEQIEASSKRVAATTSASFEEATVAVLAFSKVPGVSAAQAQVLAGSVSGLAKSMGIDLVAAAKLMTTALVDPEKALTAMASAEAPMQALDAASLALGLSLAQMGDRAGASRIAIEAYERQAKTGSDQTTALEKSVKALKEAFTGSSSGGESLAKVIGSMVTSAASAAIDLLSGVVKDFKEIYDKLKSITPELPKGPDGAEGPSGWDAVKSGVGFMLPSTKAFHWLAGSSDEPYVAPKAQAPISDMLDTAAGHYELDPEYLKRVQGSEGVFKDGRWQTSSAGAVGEMQVKPQLFSGMLKDPGNYPRVGSGTDLGNPETNIDAGAAFLSHCLQKYSDPFLALLAYHDGETVIDEMIASKGQSGGPSAAALVQARKALSGYKGTGSSSSVESMTIRSDVGLPVPPIPPPGGDPEAAERRGAILTVSMSGAAKSTAELTATLKDLRAEKEALDRVPEPLSEAQVALKERNAGLIAKTAEELRKIEQPQADAVRASEQEAAVLATVGAASQELLRTKQQISNYNQDHADQPYTEAQGNELLAATQTKLDGGYQELLNSVSKEIKETEAKIAAYDKGADAVALLDAHTRAYNDALKFAEAGTAKHRAETERLTKAYQQLDADQIKLADKQHPENQNQIDYLKAEIATLGMASDARTLYLAHIQAEQQAKIQGDGKGQAYIQHLIDEKDAIAQLNLTYQQNQAAMNYLGGQFSQAFDQISQAMTNAFVSGEGKAVNWGNVMKAVVQQVISAFLKLAVINPIINEITGQSTTQNPTLSSVISAFNGGGGGTNTSSGGGSILSTGASLVSAGSSVSQAFGGPSLAQSLGLTGPNGLLTGLGSKASTFLFGQSTSSAQIASATAPNGLMSEAAVAGQNTAGATSAQGTTGLLNYQLGAGVGNTVGSALSGFGAGVTVGTLIGTGVQSLTDKTGPGPMIGAGLGAAGMITAVALAPETFGISLLVAGLLGGAAGGGLGGLIGPHPPSTYSAAALSVEDGKLIKGPMVQQGDMARAVEQDKALTAAVGTLNDILSASGARVIAQDRYVQIGDNSNKSGPDPTKYADLGTANMTGKTAFQQFHFGSDTDALLDEKLKAKEFLTPVELAKFLESYVNAQAAFKQSMANFGDFMKQLGVSSGSLVDTIAKLNAVFNTNKQASEDLIATGMLSADQTQKLNDAEKQLSSERDREEQIARDAVSTHYLQIDQGFQSRIYNAKAADTGTPEDQFNAQLYAFDLNMQPQRDALKADLISIYGDSVTSTQSYADQMAFLERALGAERFTIIDTYNKKIAGSDIAAGISRTQAAQQATATVTSIAAYVKGLQTGQASPLSPTEKLATAQSQFANDNDKAKGGSFTALQALTDDASTVLQTAQAVYGSGTNYVEIFKNVLDTLEGVMAMGPDTLTNLVFTSQTQAQTQTLVDALSDLGAKLTLIRLQLAQGDATPSQLRTGT